MKTGSFLIGIVLCNAAAAQTEGILVPIEQVFELPSVTIGPGQPSGLPDLGGRIIPPADHADRTQSFLVASWPESIASLRASFEVSSPWYQAVLAAGEIYGAKAFLDHHYAALARFNDTVVANGDGQFSSTLLSEWDYLSSLMSLIPLNYGGLTYGGPPQPFSEDELHTLFAIRLFGTLPAPVQQGRGRLTLEHLDQIQPNGSAIDTPLTDDEIAQTLPYRRVLFTAREVTDISVQSVRFAISARFPIRILSEAAVCSSDTPVLCTVAGPAPFEIEVELRAPDLPETTFSQWHGVEVVAQVWEQGEWQDAATDMWGQEFRQCDANFVQRVNAMSGPPIGIDALLDRLSGLTSPNLDLPGRRLYPGPSRTALPGGAQTREIQPHGEAAELASTIDALARNFGLDRYLQGEGNGTTGLNRAVGFAQQFRAMLQCHRPEARSHFEGIEIELETVRRHLDMYKRIAGYAQLGRENWIARVEAQRLVIQAQADIIGTTTNAIGNSLTGEALGLFSKILATAYTSAEVASRLGTANAVIGQAGAYLQIIQSLRELDDLLDWQATIDEASAFMESEAYIHGMIRQYENAEEDLTFLLRTLRESEAAACSCYLPAPRY